MESKHNAKWHVNSIDMGEDCINDNDDYTINNSDYNGECIDEFIDGTNCTYYYLSINATINNKDSITNNCEHGLSNSNIYVTNPTSININAKSARTYGLYRNNLYATNESLLSIKCVSNWYVPK